MKTENLKEISNLVSIACGKEMQIKYIVPQQNTHKETREENLKNLANESDIPFNVIDQKINNSFKTMRKKYKNTKYIFKV